MKLNQKDKNNLNSKLKLNLDHENYNFSTGFQIYENLKKKNNDRYQYVLPYYNFDQLYLILKFNGSLNFNSNGSNNLKNTNNLRTK